MREFEFTVTETSGIHARPAGHIAAHMRQFKAEISIEKGDKRANAKKIFEIMGLHIQIGDTVKVIVSGEDEERVFTDVESYLTNNF